MTAIRTVSQEEFADRWGVIERVWDLPRNGFHWFPLADTAATGLVAFEAQPFRAALGTAWLRGALAKRSVQRVIRVPEFLDYPVEELELGEAEFQYGTMESYWLDARPAVNDWIIYVSHESSVTLGGRDLLVQVQTAWRDWAAHLWNNAPANYRPLAT